MRYVVIFRPGRQVAPRAQDKVGYWQACRDYMAEKRAEGSLEAFYWTHVLPPGLSAPTAMTGIGVLNVESVEAAQTLLQNYPGADREEGLSFELIPVLNSERPYNASEKQGYRYLATGKPTLYKARPAKDKAAFETACLNYLEHLGETGTIEYLGRVFGPEQVKAYVFLNVASHEELYAAMRCYPGTAVETGYQMAISHAVKQ